jgi:hypothetical protein
MSYISVLDRIQAQREAVQAALSFNADAMHDRRLESDIGVSDSISSSQIRSQRLSDQVSRIRICVADRSKRISEMR